jgi:hypothetical protein
MIYMELDCLNLMQHEGTKNTKDARRIFDLGWS